MELALGKLSGTEGAPCVFEASLNPTTKLM